MAFFCCIFAPLKIREKFILNIKLKQRITRYGNKRGIFFWYSHRNYIPSKKSGKRSINCDGMVYKQ